ncbi:Zn-dependent exopeptidase [Fistulina hepatica ATCC 64428]|nr:Zn-dependent exopeptidase [Fistulina hepatica ATCC 64428]
MTEGDKLRLHKAGQEFVDITEHPDSAQLRASLSDRVYEYAVTHPAGTEALSQWGRLSSEWVYEHVKGILVDHTSNINVSVSKFVHSFPQSSVIARIEAVGSDVAEKQIVVIGAHQDSLHYSLPWFRAPGADDDGSGSVTIMQVLRLLITHDFVPPSNIAVEFHWYAGEEGGLLGSQDVANAYAAERAPILAMLQMDMTAFVKAGTTPVIALFKDNVNANLTNFCTQLVDAYIPLNWTLTRCGKFCASDHMSWTAVGYPAAFAIESRYEDISDYIHSERDNTEQDGQFSFEHMLEFVKLGVAFITELAAGSKF